jgi:hypothetical protein
MAFGGVKGTLTGAANSVTASFAISTGGPITVAVGDLVYAVIAGGYGNLIGLCR